MGKLQVGRYGFVIGFVVVVHAGIVWARSNETLTAGRLLPEEMIAFIKDTSTACVHGEDGQETQKDIPEQRPSIGGVMVAEDMRCGQCHGKCAADNLRCRSQCANDSACLVHCEERSSKCEAMCKQIFQCQ